MEFPKNIQIRINIISKKRNDIAKQCEETIHSNYDPENQDFWFVVSVWLKYISKALELRIYEEYGIKVPISLQEFDKYPHCTLAKKALAHYIKVIIAIDEPVLKQKINQLTYRDEFGDLNVSDWSGYKQKYITDRLEGSIFQFLLLISDYCDKEWVRSINYIDICETVLAKVCANTIDERIVNEIDINSMSPYDFEKICSDILAANGWSSYVTKGSGDQGVDVIAEKNNIRLAIQCKLYSSNVPNKAVQEVASGGLFYNCHASIVVSNAGYTKSARQLADSLNVSLTSVEMLADEAELVYNNALQQTSR